MVATSGGKGSQHTSPKHSGVKRRTGQPESLYLRATNYGSSLICRNSPTPLLGDKMANGIRDLPDEEPPSKKIPPYKRGGNKPFISRNSVELLSRLSVRHKSLAGRLISSGVLLSFRQYI